MRGPVEKPATARKIPCCSTESPRHPRLLLYDIFFIFIFTPWSRINLRDRSGLLLIIGGRESVKTQYPAVFSWVACNKTKRQEGLYCWSTRSTGVLWDASCWKSFVSQAAYLAGDQTTKIRNASWNIRKQETSTTGGRPGTSRRERGWRTGILSRCAGPRNTPGGPPRHPNGTMTG